MRDLFGWFGETLHAKSQRDELRKQNDNLRREADRRPGRKTRLPRAAGALPPRPARRRRLPPRDRHGRRQVPEHLVLDGHDRQGRIRRRARQRPGRSTAKASSARSPQVASDGAQVDLITDSSMGVSARIGTSTATGIVQPKVGEPNDLLLQYLPPTRRPTRANTSSPPAPSQPPTTRSTRRGILIGQVTSVNEESALQVGQRAPRRSNLHNLDIVQVLTAGAGHARRQHREPGRAACRPASGAWRRSGAEQLASTGSGG